MKKTLSILLSFVVLITTAINALAQSNETINTVIEDTAEYLYQTVTEPEIGAVGGDWTVFGLARSGIEIDEEYYRNYYRNVVNQVKDNNGVLHDRKYTEYARVVLTLAAIGKDAEDVGGYNLVEPLLDYDKTISQGLNGAIWSIIALDSGNYGTDEIRNQYIEYILSRELDGGGWALSEKETTAEVDITSMALVALSNYMADEGVSKAVERGTYKLSKMQNENGGFSSYNVDASESTAQVLTALSTLGISYNDERFVKNGNTLIDNLMSFYKENKGFAHIQNADEINFMATEQCFYALVAMQRFLNDKSSLFDMKDAIKLTDTTTVGLPSKNPDITKREIKYQDRTFEDIRGHKNQTAIEELAKRGVINGMSDSEFCPDNTMTRAEFATIVINALGVSIKSVDKFADVTPSEWFYNYVGTAYSYGIVSGVSENEFNPNGTITREEAAAMVTRASKLCGMNTEMKETSIRNVLAEFVDYVTVSEWAKASVAFCYEQNILDRNEIEINPMQAITRAEIAQMIYKMLGKAELL